MPNTIVHIDLVDPDGYAKGRSIPVSIDYIEILDEHYGADADGAQGAVLISREIMDASIALEDLLTLNSADVEYALDEARHIFSNRIR